MKSFKNITLALLACGAPLASAMSPLHRAIVRGDSDEARVLLGRGADVNELLYVNVPGGRCIGTPLHGAACGGRLEIARLLIEHGADVNAVGGSGKNTPLHEAVIAASRAAAPVIRLGDERFAERMKVVELLLNSGASRSVRDGIRGKTAQELAVESGCQDLASLLTDLLEGKVDLKDEPKSHGTPSLRGIPIVGCLHSSRDAAPVVEVRYFAPDFGHGCGGCRRPRPRPAR